MNIQNSPTNPPSAQSSDLYSLCNEYYKLWAWSSRNPNILDEPEFDKDWERLLAVEICLIENGCVKQLRDLRKKQP